MPARPLGIEEEAQRIEDENSTMTLSELLKDVTVQKIFQTMYGRMVVTHEVEIHAIQYDSRKVQRGDVFVAICGTLSDGHQFIPSAIDSGAKAVVVERNDVLPDSYFMHTGVVKVVVPDTRVALARMAARFYDYPVPEAHDGRCHRNQRKDDNDASHSVDAGICRAEERIDRDHRI